MGGGLAGLASACRLAAGGYAVALVEQKTYPFHKVCGEYVSEEVRPYLESLGIDVGVLGAVPIRRLQVSSPAGKVVEAKLPLGGFGISRYRLDEALAKQATALGAELITGERVEDITPEGNSYQVNLRAGDSLRASLVWVAHGKRTLLDQRLERAFMQKPTDWLAVKYHVKVDFPNDLIALHNFRDGYCGISRVEDGRYCLCYLTRRRQLKHDIPTLEQEVLSKNQYLKDIFAKAEHLYDKPLVINAFSFAPKPQVEQGLWMLGDAAGLIPPLCGNGMAMALHASYMATEVLFGSNFKPGEALALSLRAALEANYAREWRKAFARRLWVGRQLQASFGHPVLTEAIVRGLRPFPRLVRSLIRQTHGQAFVGSEAQAV